MNKNTINAILLRRKQRLIIFEEDKDARLSSFQRIYGFNEELRSQGYILSSELMVEMMKISYEKFDEYAENIIKTLKEMTGSDVEHKPMYKNFPESVRNASDIKLFVDQITGYSIDFYGVLNDIFHFAEGTVNLRNDIQFDGEKKERIKLNDNIEYKVINPETLKGFEDMFVSMMKQNSALSESDKKDLDHFLKEYPDSVSFVPESIPFKETMVFVYALLMDMNVPGEKLPIKNATDLLRLSVAMSDGDVSLAKAPHFRKFKRKERTLLLNILNNIEPEKMIEDLLRHEEEYKRLIERLGLFSRRYRDRYPKLCVLFRDIYDHKRFNTFNSRYEEAFKSNDYRDALNVLKKRPGVFCRYLDKLLRESEKDSELQEEIFKTFETVSSKVEAKLLWDLLYHFTYRDEERIAFPKGEVTSAMAVSPQAKDLSQETLNRIISLCNKALDRHYQEKKEMSYVYVDEELKNYIMPFASRSSSRTSQALTRGSHLKIREGADFLRMFVYWIGEDVDLSVTVLDDQFRYIDHVSYTNLRMQDEKEGSYPIIHSGDITYAPEGASEFVDVDLKALNRLYPDARYIAESVFSYSTPSFNMLEKCFAGIMERDNSDLGEIFEPSTVRIKADITGAHRYSIPLILDLLKKEIIWCDICGARNYLESHVFPGNNVENNLEMTALSCKAFVNLKKANVYEVIMRNVTNRHGRLTSRKLIDDEYHYYDSEGKQIDRKDVTIFSVDEGITPKDMEILVSEYL